MTRTTLTKADLIGCVQTAGFTKGAAEQAVTAVFGAIAAAIAHGRDAKLPGIGTLTLKDQPARSGRIGARSYERPAGKRLVLHVASSLKEAINP